MIDLRSYLGRILSVVMSLLITSIAFSAVAPQQAISKLSVKALESQIKMPPQTTQTDVAPEPQNKDPTRSWNLKDAELRTLINEVSTVTGKTFVVGPNVSAKVTFISQNKLTPDELYQAFIALLRAYGFDAIPEGKVVKIVPIGTSKSTAAGILLSDANTENGPIVVTTYRVKNYPVSDLVKILTPLLPKYSYLEAYKPSNDLIIADDAENIPNIIDLIKRLDKPVSQHVEIISLQYAIAEDLAKTLNDLLNASNKGQNIESEFSRMTIVPDIRSNKLIVNGGTAEQRRELMSMIAHLDGKRHVLHEETEVIYLRYLPVETFAPIVQNLLNNYLLEATGKPADSRGTEKSTNTGTASQNPPSLMGNFNLQNPLANQSSTGATNPLGGGGSVAGGGFTSQQPSKTGTAGPRVQWEQSTNSIVITAPRELISRVKKIVAQLDIRRPQVLIEVIIAEFNTDKNTELGVDWSEFNNQFNTRFTPTNPMTQIDSVQQRYSTGGVLNAVGSGLTVGIFQGMNLHALVRALKNNNKTNILATPNILTLDNEPAIIKIGSIVSFAIGQINNNPTGGNPFTSFTQEDVGLTLSIKPQITPNGSVRLYIEQTLSSVIPGSGSASGNPDLSQRYIQTTVMADDGQILVLGGLLQNQYNLTEKKVPLLGDIPYIGSLFKNKYKDFTKSNLMLFLKPVIIYDADESGMVTTRKYREMLAEPGQHKIFENSWAQNYERQSNMHKFDARYQKEFLEAHSEIKPPEKVPLVKVPEAVIILPSPWA